MEHSDSLMRLFILTILYCTPIYIQKRKKLERITPYITWKTICTTIILGIR